MPLILENGKKKWKPEPRSKVMRGSPLNPNAANEARYYQELRYLVRTMSAGVQRELEAFYKTPHAEAYFAEDASTAAQAKILTKAMTDRFQKIFDIASKPLAEEVASDAAKSSAAALKMSLQKLSGGLTIKADVLTNGYLKDIFTASVAENVGLIKSIASEYLTDVQGQVMRSITTGRGLADLIPYLQSKEGITLRRAKNIALDQTRKAFGSMNKARLQKIGMDDYEWLHHGGSQHPRKLHIAMSGKFYKWSDPPIVDEKSGRRGFPSSEINCGCRAIPVIKFD